MKLLNVEHLTKTFGGLTANNKLTFSVGHGEIVGLIGPNGAGKSTLFNCIAGFYQPDEGNITLNGKDITGMRPDQICRLGISRTFQKARIFGEMTVADNVMVGAFRCFRRRLDAEELVSEVLDLTRLAVKRDTLGRNLTIADKKRLEIARAVAAKPVLLLLDEAMAGLTPTEFEEAVKLIEQISESGITILMVEHVMEVIMPISDRVVVLDGGSKIAEDVPAAIVRNPQVIDAYLGAGSGA